MHSELTVQTLRENSGPTLPDPTQFGSQDLSWEQLKAQAEENPANTILAKMWNLQEQFNIAKEPKKEYFLLVKVFSNV